MKETHSEKRQLPGVQPEQTVRAMDTAPLPGIGTLASPGTLISTFCASFTLVGPGSLTPLRFLQHPDFSGAVTPSG